MNFATWLQSDLTKPLKVQALHGVFFSADNAANLIGVEVYNNGTAASLSGTCIGYAIRADGGTLTITGTVSGNKASIILPTSAYVIEGPLDIVIKVVSGSVKTTVGACRGYVQRATTDTIIDPGHVIPSLEELLAQIDACEQATDAANAAATNANSKASAANTATTRANNAAAALENMDATATTLTPGSSATASVSTVSGHYRLALGVPKGDIGPAPTIANTATTYQNSTSGTTIPTGTWQTTQPETPQGQYLWIRTILTWNNNQTTTLYSVSRMGIDGSGSVVSVNNISPDANGNVTLPTDTTPTQNSTNYVTSGGIYTEAGNLAAGMAILSNNNTHAAIASGQYVYVRGHSTLAEGLYRATAAIAANGTLSTSNLTAVSGGGLNALKSSVDTLNTNLTSYQYISNRALTALVTSIDNGDDLNTFTTPGMYYSNNKTVSNAPYATTYFHLMVFGFNGTVIQIWCNLAGAMVYVRGIFGTTIGTWNRIQMVTA